MLWNPELNGSEEAKEQACETVVCAVLMARPQVASHPDRMTPFPLYPRRARSALGVDIVLTLDVCLYVCMFVC